MIRAAAILALAFLLAACGQKGPLKLPPGEPAPAVPAPPTPTTPSQP